jgi:hypothetical protein
VAGALQILRDARLVAAPLREEREMAKVLVQLETPVQDPQGRVFTVRICGRPAGNLWEGWIEFHPNDDGPVLRTPRETEQPNEADLEYWATGLTVPYLEGAMDRALHPETPDLRPRLVAVEPAYDGPAPPSASVGSPPVTRTILNPFTVYRQGEEVLRAELRALDVGHLRNIVRAHDLSREVPEPPGSATRGELVEWIVERVRERQEK